MAVVGGGPVGSRIASRLAEMGCRVVVAEQKESLGEPVCCTGIISQECASYFAIDESVIFRRANSAKVFSPSDKLISLWRQEPQACIVDRAAFNVALARCAQSRGVEYVLGYPVESIEIGNDRVSVTSNLRGGAKSFEARAVVIATGFAPKLVEELGLGKVGDFVMGVQAEVETTGVDEVEVYLGQKIAPAFFAWLVPTSSQRALVGLLSRRSPGFYLRRLMSSLLAQGKIASTEVELRYGGVPLKPLTRTYSDRVMVVGSAAGQVKPTTGG
ncbi:geranylgeranyl reductase family protein, partial [Chloroflexota bacterium]